MVILQLTSDELFDIIYKSSRKAAKEEILALQNNLIQSKKQDRYLTRKQTAQHIGKGVQTVDLWAKRGYLKKYKSKENGNIVTFRLSEVEAFLEGKREEVKHEI